jgi:hypothetical protein
MALSIKKKKSSTNFSMSDLLHAEQRLKEAAATFINLWLEKAKSDNELSSSSSLKPKVSYDGENVEIYFFRAD